MTAVSKRYIQTHVLNWLTNELGIGPAIGNVFYMAQAGTAMESMLLANGVPDSMIYHTLATAYAVTTAAQNDVVLITPGLYTETTMTTWANSCTHLIGLGGSNQRCVRQGGGDYSVAIRNTATTGLDAILYVTGHNCQFMGFDMQNDYNSDTNRTDLKIGGRNLYFKNCCFRGGDSANQINHDDAGLSVLFADVAGAGNGCRFDRCHFGNSSNDTKTAGFVMMFEGTHANTTGYFIEFDKCVFEMRCETGTSTAVGLVNFNAVGGTDRYTWFKDCLFYNFWQNHGGSLAYVMVQESGYTHDIILDNCVAHGFTAWANNNAHIFAPETLSTGHMGQTVAVHTS
jgi:hypothetical protein